MIWRAVKTVAKGLGSGVYWTLGAAETVLELFGVVKRLGKEAKRGKLPHDLKLDDTDPIPLSRPKPPPTLRSVGKK